jgi:hypothetical protein
VSSSSDAILSSTAGVSPLRSKLARQQSSSSSHSGSGESVAAVAASSSAAAAPLSVESAIQQQQQQQLEWSMASWEDSDEAQLWHTGGTNGSAASTMDETTATELTLMDSTLDVDFLSLFAPSPVPLNDAA